MGRGWRWRSNSRVDCRHYEAVRPGDDDGYSLLFASDTDPLRAGIDDGVERRRKVRGSECSTDDQADRKDLRGQPTIYLRARGIAVELQAHDRRSVCCRLLYRLAWRKAVRAQARLT